MTQNGIREWKIQRLTALYLMGYTFFLFAFIFQHSPVSYEQWHGLFLHPIMQMGTLFALIAIAWHAWIGLTIILTDYIKPLFFRFTCQSIILLMLAGYVVWGSFILWGK